MKSDILMRAKYSYELLFRWAFPEWSGPIPPLPEVANEIEMETAQEKEPGIDEIGSTAEEIPRLTGKWFLWEVLADEQSNITRDAKQKNTTSTITKVVIHCGDPKRAVAVNGIPEFDDQAVHFLPNAMWVFAMDPQFAANIQFWDPVVAKWMQNTESFQKVQELIPMDVFGEDDLITTFVSMYDGVKDNTWMYETEIPHMRILGMMHHRSFSLDLPGMQAMRSGLTKEMTSLEKEIYSLAGKEFNILSPLEVSDVLFNEMGITNPDKKHNSYSVDSRHRVVQHREFAPTNLHVLEKIEHPIAAKILRYRTIQKLISTWLSFDNHCDENGRLHPDFFVCATATGRISVRNPNLQNIPSDTTALNIRSLFLPGDSQVLISVDFCQLELRLLAHLAQEDKLRSLCRRTDLDLHTHIANIIFSVEQSDEAQREEAKRLVYATIYGKVPSRDCLDLGLRTKTVLDAFPGIRDFTARTAAFATRYGFVETVCGKRRFLPNIKSPNPQQRLRDQRMAINTVVQGSAADFVKFALTHIMKKMDGQAIEPLVQLHDEWVFRTPFLCDSEEFKSLVTTLHNVTYGAAEQMGITVPIPSKITFGHDYGHMTRFPITV